MLGRFNCLGKCSVVVDGPRIREAYAVTAIVVDVSIRKIELSKIEVLSSDVSIIWICLCRFLLPRQVLRRGPLGGLVSLCGHGYGCM